MKLADAVVLITGASRGIGRAILMAFAEQGAVVIGTATTQSGADSINEALQKAGYAGAGMVLDVTNNALVESVIEEIQTKFGDIHVLVNNAGITDDALLMRMKPEQWNRVIDTNLSSVFRLCKAVLRGMIKMRSGRIINIASVVGVMGNAGQTNYAAAKAGVIGFSKSLAREVGSRGVTVNVVAPGFIVTDMTNSMSDAQKKSLYDAIPMAKFGTPEDVAAAVTFLASADYITGETLHVNGGMYMV